MRGHVEEFLKEKDIPYRSGVSAATLSTFRIGGVCDVATPICLQQLMELTTYCAYHDHAYRIIGRGSNLLFGDDRIEALLIKTDLLDAAEIGAGYALVQCGCSLPRLARRVAALGYADLAFAVGIPGSVGGAVYMNAGALGKEFSSLVTWVEAYDPLRREIRTYFNKELNYSYRNSRFQSGNEVVLRASLRLELITKKDEILDVMRLNIKKRASSQPLEMPSVGSAFRRSAPDIAIGKLLDDLGLKGLRRGGAAISEKHAGFIVNLGGATARDVKELTVAVQKIVEEKTGIHLTPEFQEIT